MKRLNWIRLLLVTFFSLLCIIAIASEGDADGDGIPDAEELAKGYNPAVVTRIVYVDASRTDDSGDGLTEATATFHQSRYQCSESYRERKYRDCRSRTVCWRTEP